MYFLISRPYYMPVEPTIVTNSLLPRSSLFNRVRWLMDLRERGRGGREEEGERERERKREREKERERERERAIINLITYMYANNDHHRHTQRRCTGIIMCILHRTSILHEHIHVKGYNHYSPSQQCQLLRWSESLRTCQPRGKGTLQTRFKTKAILCQLYTRFLKQQSIIQLPTCSYLKVLSRSHSTYTICTYMSCIYTSTCVHTYMK